MFRTVGGVEASVSDATVGRLPAYLRAAVDLGAEGVATVSSDALAEAAGVNSATLRRDLASLDISGTRGVGYDTKYLVFQISHVLGLNKEWPVVIVGAGNLSRALANYAGLSGRGFPVRAVLDVSEALVGKKIGSVKVSHVRDAAAIIEAEEIEVGVIATPAEAAQEAADLLVSLGVQSLLNFTATTILVPSEVVVRGVDIATELQILSFYRQRANAVLDGTGVPLGDRSWNGSSV